MRKPPSILVGGRSVSAPLVACVMLAACAPLRSPSSSAVVAPQPVIQTPGTLSYEQRLEERLRIEDRQGDLANEAITLELLAILKPNDVSVTTRRQALNDRIGVAVHDHLRRGSEAYRRGLLDAAANQYLAALALSPTDQVAADALRAIEKDRNRRLLLVKQKRAAQAPEQGD